VNENEHFHRFDNSPRFDQKDLKNYIVWFVQMQNYTQSKLLGTGAYAEVYLAQQNDTSQSVAIKRVNVQKLISTNQNIEHEINLLKQIHHPHIVECLDSFKDNDEICIVMEYVSGSTLRDFLKNTQHPLPETFIRKFIYQLFSAIIYLHNMGIIHRNINPENILISQEGDAKLTNFGLSCVVDSIRLSPQSYAGTENYMSPEMIQQKPYSYSTDIWSLGCVFYEVLNNYHPFGTNMFDIIQNMNAGNIYPIPFPIPVDIQNLVTSMLVTIPENRISLNRVIELGFAPSLMKLLLEQFEKHNQEIQTLTRKIRILDDQNQFLYQMIQTLGISNQEISSLAQKVKVIEKEMKKFQNFHKKLKISKLKMFP
jgi:serine/threonine protein kinase